MKVIALVASSFYVPQIFSDIEKTLLRLIDIVSEILIP